MPNPNDPGRKAEPVKRRLAHNPYVHLPRGGLKVPSLAAQDDARFEMQFMEEILSKDPCNEDALMLLGSVYSRRGDYQKGLDMDRRLVRLRPDDPTAFYNLACSYSLLGRLDDAFAAIERAVALGYNELKLILTDPDLANLRRDDRFQGFLRRLQRNVGNS